MATKQTLEPQNPLMLRCNRLIEAFAKSDDERDFYLDRREGFIIYVDLDKAVEELQVLEKELEKNSDRYCMIPKLTFYETKKIMEGFINEKVYDIDTKEKLLDIIQSKEARENFLDFIYDHHSELEKWQTYYQERSRIRIIEWLRSNNFQFVFEEDLDLPRIILEKLKKELFETKVGKDILNARKTLYSKSKTYYSNEALNPRPKRGRPPKQALKAEIEPQITTDIYTTVPNGLRGFLFTPDLNSPSSATFSSKFGNEEDLYSRRVITSEADLSLESLNLKLAALRSLSTKWKESEENKKKAIQPTQPKIPAIEIEYDFDEDEDEADDLDDEDEDELDFDEVEIKTKPKALNGFNPPKKSAATPPKIVTSKIQPSKKIEKKPFKTESKPIQKKKVSPPPKAKGTLKSIIKPKSKPAPKMAAKTAPTKKPAAKALPPKKKKR